MSHDKGLLLRHSLRELFHPKLRAWETRNLALKGSQVVMGHDVASMFSRDVASHRGCGIAAGSRQKLQL